MSKEVIEFDYDATDLNMARFEATLDALQSVLDQRVRDLPPEVIDMLSNQPAINKAHKLDTIINELL